MLSTIRRLAVVLIANALILLSITLRLDLIAEAAVAGVALVVVTVAALRFEYQLAERDVDELAR